MRATTVSCAWRLALARTLAWSLLIGGWLVLGEAGQQRLPLWAGGLVPLALWLAGIGALLVWLRGRRVPPRRVSCVGLLPCTAALALLAQPGAPSLLVAALAWSGLAVYASLVVKAMRRAASARPPAPLLPAAAGALVAWVAASQGDVRIAAAAAGVAALVLAWLMPRGVAAVPACRAGLFDCSWPLPAPARWQRPADWPQQAAQLAMLPMMATLPAMAHWCRGDWGWSPSISALVHLAAMLLPALLLRRWLVRAGLPAARRVIAVLLLASGAVLWLRPGLGGLMAATLLQAGAWSLAWASPMLQPTGTTPGAHRSPPGDAALQAASAAAAVLALGAALAAHGPDALRAVQAGLAALGLAGAAAGAIGAIGTSVPSNPTEKQP